MSSLSSKQMDFIIGSTAPINLASGTVRSGKTFAQILRGIDFIYNEAPRGSQILIAGKTLETVYNNIIRDFIRLEASAGDLEYKNRRIQVKSRDIEIIVCGASDERSQDRIRGCTLSGAFFDEITLLPKSFVDMAFSRLSADGKLGKAFATCNPTSPSHWVHTKLIEQADKLKVKNWAFSFEDNPVLSEEYIEQQKRLYTGIFYQRNILGKWAIGQGSIFENFSREKNVITKEFFENRMPRIKNYYLGIDWGYEEAMGCLLIAEDAEGILYVIKELKQTKTLIDMAFVDTLRKNGWFVHAHPYGAIKSVCVADSARPDLITQFYKLSSLQVHPSRKTTKLEQINNTAVKFNLRDNKEPSLYILDTCTKLIAELDQYRWKEVGGVSIDEPVKENDHLIDCLLYINNTMFSSKVRVLDKAKLIPGGKASF